MKTPNTGKKAKGGMHVSFQTPQDSPKNAFKAKHPPTPMPKKKELSVLPKKRKPIAEFKGMKDSPALQKQLSSSKKPKGGQNAPKAFFATSKKKGMDEDDDDDDEDDSEDDDDDDDDDVYVQKLEKLKQQLQNKNVLSKQKTGKAAKNEDSDEEDDDDDMESDDDDSDENEQAVIQKKKQQQKVKQESVSPKVQIKQNIVQKSLMKMGQAIKSQDSDDDDDDDDDDSDDLESDDSDEAEKPMTIQKKQQQNISPQKSKQGTIPQKSQAKQNTIKVQMPKQFQMADKDSDKDDDDDDDDMESDDDDDDDDSDEDTKPMVAVQKKAQQSTKMPQKQQAKQNSSQKSPVKLDQSLGTFAETDTARKKERDSRKLFVRGLPVSVSADDLKTLSPDIIDVHIPNRRPHQKYAYAFLEFNNEKKAEANHGVLKGKKFKGQELFVDFCGEKSSTFVERQKTQEKGQDTSPKQYDKKKLSALDLPVGTTIVDIASLFPKAVQVFLNSNPDFRNASAVFKTEEDAEEALKETEKAKINGKSITILYSLVYGRNQKRKRGGGRTQSAKKRKFAVKSGGGDDDDDGDDSD